jgi:ABC-2 type transport system ATP-binding protein
MIQVANLVKKYGEHTAIDEVSFSVEKGEILGFLGPNGAGKTTTMRILAGFFPATEGRAKVAGFDVAAEPMEAKRRIGYLPESPPLYNEMTVNSYLRFVARIKGVESAEMEKRLEYVKGRCGLDDEGERLIKHLSKGFKQRVGLAQSLIHDPSVLILDEPTIGLDPKQIIEVRELIKSLGGNHTIVLSTHILPEVSMTCERVVIINNGKIVAEDTPGNLTTQVSGGDRIELQVSGPLERLPELIGSLPGITSIASPEPLEKGHRVWIEHSGKGEVRHLITRELVKSGFDVYQIRSEGMSLEQVFLKLTTEEVVS